MAFAHVQIQSAGNGNWGSIASSTAITVSMPGSFTSGNLIIVEMTFGVNNTFTAKDNGGAGQTLTSGPKVFNAGDNQGIQFFYGIANGSSGSSIQVTLSAGTTWTWVRCHEVSGNATTSFTDGTFTGATGSSTSLNSGNLTTTVNGDYVYGTMMSTSAVGGTFTPTNSFASWDDDWLGHDMVSVDQTQGTAATIAATGTASLSGGWAALVGAFQPSGGSPPATVNSFLAMMGLGV